jgi:hypothetical protein
MRTVKSFFREGLAQCDSLLSDQDLEAMQESLEAEYAQKDAMMKERRREMLLGKKLPAVPLDFANKPTTADVKAAHRLQSIDTNAGRLQAPTSAAPFSTFPASPVDSPYLSPPSPPKSGAPSIKQPASPQSDFPAIKLPASLNLSTGDQRLVSAMCEPEMKLLKALCLTRVGTSNVLSNAPSTLYHINSTLKILEHTETLVAPFLSNILGTNNRADYFARQLFEQSGSWHVAPMGFPHFNVDLTVASNASDAHQFSVDALPALVLKQFLLQHGRFFLEKTIQPSIAQLFDAAGKLDDKEDRVDLTVIQDVAQNTLLSIFRHRGLLPRYLK